MTREDKDKLDIMYLELKKAVDDIQYGYGLNLEEFRSSSIRAKNRINELIEMNFKDRYLEESIKNNYSVSPNNIRYIECVCCGHIGNTTQFIVYGGKGNKRTQGLCKFCDELMLRGELNEESMFNYINYRDDNDSFVTKDCI